MYVIKTIYKIYIYKINTYYNAIVFSCVLLWS